MRKIVRSLTCPSEYSIGVNANLHSPSSLSLSLSLLPPSLHRRKSAATGSNDSEPRSVTHSSEGGPERDISCVYPVDQARPAINQRKANRFQLMHRYRSLVAAGGNLEMPWIFVSNCAISARFHPKGGENENPYPGEIPNTSLPRICYAPRAFSRSSNYVRSRNSGEGKTGEGRAAKFSIEMQE